MALETPMRHLIWTAPLLTFALACGGGSGSGGTASAPPSVTVTSGSADGYSGPGDTVHLFADPAPAGQVFDHWAGDAALLLDPEAWHTTFILGSQSANFTAVYRSAPAWPPVQASVNGADFWYFVPPSAKGLIFCFHGRGGTGPSWFQRPATRQFLDEAVAAGYGVAALTSIYDQPSLTPGADPNSGMGWNLTFDLSDYPASLSQNPDLQNVKAGLDLLASVNLITASTPLFAAGSSNGGRMSVRAAAALVPSNTGYSPFLAVVNHVSQGDPAQLMDTYAIPVRFDMQVNDHGNGDIVSYQDAQAYSQGMASRGVPSEFELNQPAPVYPTRFTRIPGLSASDSQTIQQALKAGGYLDARDFIVMKGPSGSDPNDPMLNPSSWTGLIPSAYRTLSILQGIQDELQDAYAEHGFFSDPDDRDLAFFKARLP